MDRDEKIKLRLPPGIHAATSPDMLKLGHHPSGISDGARHLTGTYMLGECLDRLDDLAV